MAHVQIRITGTGRVKWAPADKAARLVADGRAEYAGAPVTAVGGPAPVSPQESAVAHAGRPTGRRARGGR